MLVCFLKSEANQGEYQCTPSCWGRGDRADLNICFLRPGLMKPEREVLSRKDLPLKESTEPSNLCLTQITVVNSK